MVNTSGMGLNDLDDSKNVIDKYLENLQEILSDEIKTGDKIVIDGQYLLQDNDRVEEVK